MKRISRWAARHLWKSIDPLTTIVHGPSIRTRAWSLALKATTRIERHK